MTRSEMRQSEHFRFARLKRACPGPRSTRSVLVVGVAEGLSRVGGVAVIEEWVCAGGGVDPVRVFSGPCGGQVVFVELHQVVRGGN